MPILVNGVNVEPPADPRVSLLDLLRERLELHGTKLGCNQGACGACTVLGDGNERILSCLALAVQYEGRSITTVEGLAYDGTLHPLQQAFIDCDGFQCGYCTPGRFARPSAWSRRSGAACPATLRAICPPRRSRSITTNCASA